MLTEINLHWNGGHSRAKIYLDKFFPCTLTDAKKLFNLCDLDYTWGVAEWTQLDEYFSFRMGCIREEYQAKYHVYCNTPATAKGAHRVLAAEKNRLEKNYTFFKRLKSLLRERKSIQDDWNERES